MAWTAHAELTVGVALAELGAVPLGIPLNMIGDTIASGYVDAHRLRPAIFTTTTKGVAGTRRPAQGGD